MRGVTLEWAQYEIYRPDWDHDHCTFCNAKFSLASGDLHAGYRTPDSYHWVCASCFGDFESQFAWVVKQRGPG